MTGGPSGSLFCCRTAAERRAGCAEGENACGLEASLAEKDAMFLLSAQREGLPALVRKEERHAVFCSPAQRERWHCRTKKQESGKGGCRYPGVSFRHAGKGSAGCGQECKIFCGKMLDGVAEKAHKAVRANELVMPARATGKEIFPDGKKVLDAGLKMRHTSPSRQRVAPAGPRKKLSRNEKNLLTAKTKRRKQLLRAE